MDGDFVSLALSVGVAPEEHEPTRASPQLRIRSPWSGKAPSVDGRRSAWFRFFPFLVSAWFENVMTKLVLQKRFRSHCNFAACCAELGHIDIQFRLSPSWHHVALHSPHATRSAVWL